MFWFVVDRPIVDTREENSVTTAAELKKEHVRRGEPGKGLTAKALVGVRKAMQSGQDSYRQRYGGSLGPHSLQNPLIKEYTLNYNRILNMI